MAGQEYDFKRIRGNILENAARVEQRDESSFASLEGALLDTLYLHTDYQFDHLDGLDWDQVFETLPIYESQRMTRTVQALYRQATGTDHNHETGYRSP